MYIRHNDPPSGASIFLCRLNWVDLYGARISVSDVYNMTSKVDPHTLIVNIFMLAVDLYHSYSNESDKAK